MFKEFLKHKGISESDYLAKSVEDMASLQVEYQDWMAKKLKDEFKNSVSKEDFATIETSVNDLVEKLTKVDNTAFETLQTKMQEMSDELLKLKEGNGEGSIKSLNSCIKDALEDIVLVKEGNKNEAVIKATVTRASITSNTNSEHLPTIGQLGVRRRSLYDIFTKIPVTRGGNHKGTITYTDWDEASIVRAAATVAEGASFPESTATFREYNTALIKIGDTLPVTEEFGEDQAMAAAELQRFIEVNVNTRVDAQIATGTGGGTQLDGLLNSTPEYSVPDLSIPGANIYDLVTKMKSGITQTRGSKYTPDFVVANDTVWDQLRLTKDDNNNYIFRDITSISGCEIIVDNNMPDNQLVVGDSRFANIYEMTGVEITDGRIGNDFIQDVRRIKGRVRLLFLIRQVDRTGFLKETDITAALTTLAP